MPHGIYVASRARHAPMWLKWRDEQGKPIISTWIDEAAPGATTDWPGLWVRCTTEAASAAAFILYADHNDRSLRGAFVELGAALSHGVRCFVVAPFDLMGNLRYDMRIQMCISIAQAFWFIENTKPLRDL